MQYVRGILVALAVVSVSGVAAVAEEPAPKTPPLVEYSTGSRSSKDWVALPNGTRVAVDKGGAWNGVKVYLSMTWNLVAVDETTKKTLWARSVGAYWNAFTFKEVTPEDGTKRWAVELRPGGRRPDAGRRQYHDLRTGKKFEIPGLVQTPSGTAFDVRVTWRGDKSDIAKAYRVMITDEASWRKLQERMFPAYDPARFTVVDWESEVVFALSAGNSSNCSGYSAEEAYEDGGRVLLRLERVTFQTMNGFQKARPWAFVVLPRRAKAYEVEINSQGLIGGPPLWKQIYKAEQLPDAKAELAKLPPKSNKAHHGWESGGFDTRLPPPPPPKKPK